MLNNPLYSPVVPDLPSQMIPLSEKTDEWKERCLNTLEQVGRAQYIDNLKLIENYEMVKGRFIYKHYFQNEGYTDFIAQLTNEFELPSYLRHYDIISQVINTLSGEYQKRPDTFKVKNNSEDATNEYERTKTELIHKYVTSKIEAEINQKLLERDLDPERTDFQSEEEQQQYQQVIDQTKKELTPPEIQEYMTTKWTQQAEIWAEHQLQLDKQRFNTAEKEKKEFEDMLISDRCFRHFYLTPTGYNQETWNPVQTFFQKSPDVEYVEEGDYIGRIFYMSIPSIIDKYGHLMKAEELELLQVHTGKYDKEKWNYSTGSEYVFNEYMMPFKGFQGYDIATKTNPNISMSNSASLPYLDNQFFDSLNSGKFFMERRGLYFVTECYWKSQRKIGKVTFIDPETGLLTKRFVDETFIVPEGFKELDSNFQDSNEVNTVVWTWVNQVWKGIKINLKNTVKGKNLYLDVRPLEFQFKGDFNPYGAKLPVCGRVFSPRNSTSMSLVDLMKPYQIFYNVAMNQLYQVMEREIGRFIVMDVNMFPDLKDWGGENGWEKFMMIAKQMGIAPADTSPQNIKGSVSASGGYLPKEFNFDDTARMMSRLKLAETFEQMALRQVGFNEYRLGSYSAYSSAGGAEQGRQASYAQTESFFTNFSNYLRRVHEMDLAIAQYVQSQNKDVTVMYTKSDMSRAYIKVMGTDLLTADLEVRVTNSLEYVRQMETLKQLAIQNNTTNATISDLAEIITATSPEAIKVKLKESVAKQQELQDRNYQLEVEKLDQEKQIEQANLEQKERHFKETLQNNLDVAYIKEGSKIVNSPEPVVEDNTDGIKVRQQEHKESTEQSKQDLQRQALMADMVYKNKKLALEQAKINKDLQIQQEKLQMTKILKNKK